MEKVIIQTDGTLIHQGKSRDYNPLALLGCLVELETGFTLESVFKMIGLHPVFRQLNPVIEALEAILFKSKEMLYKTDEIDYLEFSKTIEVEGFPGPPSLKIYTALLGRHDQESLGLKFFQLEMLAGHELRLGKLRHIVFGDREDALTYETFYTLFELIEGISWELSFNFNPLHCSIRR